MIKPIHTMSNETLVEIFRARGVERGAELLALPGMTVALASVRAGKGHAGDGSAIGAVWDEAGLDRPQNCSDARAGILYPLVEAAYRAGVREGVGS